LSKEQFVLFDFSKLVEDSKILFILLREERDFKVYYSLLKGDKYTKKQRKEVIRNHNESVRVKKKAINILVFCYLLICGEVKGKEEWIDCDKRFICSF